MRKFRHHKYTWVKPTDYTHHQWSLVGPRGGVHFSAVIPPLRDEGWNEPSVGLEIHYRTPPDHMTNHAPNHTDCWLLGGWCWHDGTSLYARERLWPEIERYLAAGDHENVFRVLEYEYDRAFAVEKADDEVPA